MKRFVWIAAALFVTACSSEEGTTRLDSGQVGNLDGGPKGLDGASQPVDLPRDDANAVDAGAIDANTADAPAADANAVDAPAIDVSMVDASLVDANRVDVGTVDVGAVDGTSSCSLGTAASLATSSSLDLFGKVVYYADGASLPAGRYSIKYVDGCMKYSSGQGWTVHAYKDGHIAWWFVGATTAKHIIMPPGTVGWDPKDGAFDKFEDCVAANKLLPAEEFDFEGGKLGVWLLDSPYSDNMAGVDGRNPKWELRMLGCDGGAP